MQKKFRGVAFLLHPVEDWRIDTSRKNTRIMETVHMYYVQE